MIIAGLDLDRLARSVIAHRDGAPYLERYDVAAYRDTTVRLHHWLGSDDQAAPHDHPWPNTTTVLAGRLLEHDAAGDHELEPGTIVTRRATDAHRIELITADAWTLFVAGPIERRWGFHTDTGWVHWRNWPGAGHYLTELERPAAAEPERSRSWSTDDDEHERQPVVKISGWLPARLERDRDS